ncbi:MAG: glycosyltransferase family 1 protein [candidate division WOR-3 bacterium]
MRILFDASFCTGTKVGISTYIFRLVPELANLGEVTVLTSFPELFAGLRCSVIPIPAWTRTNRGRLLWQLSRLAPLAHGKQTVLFCPTPVAPPGCRIPVISVVHDLTPLRLPSLQHSKTKLLFWLPLQTLRWADAVITDSRHTRVDLLETKLVPPQRIYTVPLGPGIAPELSSSGDSCSAAVPEFPFILYVGGHIPNKNVPRLIRAFSQIRYREELKLVIVGWGWTDHIQRTRMAVERCGVADKVVIYDELSDRELSLLYRRAAVFVFPSLYEGFGLPVLEAMAHGTPCVCSSAASIPELAGDAAIYVDPYNTDSIRQGIELILENKELSEELSSRARRRAATYSWKRTAQAVYQIARSLL